MRKSILFSLAVLAVSCGRNRTHAPEISLEEVSPGTVQEYQDSIYMRISFYDKDGDLGENFTDDPNLFVVDNRLGLACLLYTSPSPRDRQKSRMPSSA